MQINQSFPKGTTDRQALNYILGQMGLTLSENADTILSSVLSPVPYATGITLFGPAKRYLAQLSAGFTDKEPNPFISHGTSTPSTGLYNPSASKSLTAPKTSLAQSTSYNTLNPSVAGSPFDWTVEDNVFVVSCVNAASTNKVVLVNADTGLLQSPSRFYDRKRKDTIFLNVTTLLDPKLRPHTAISLKSKDYQGIYRILSVSHSGSTQESYPFQSYLTCQEIIGATV